MTIAAWLVPAGLAFGGSIFDDNWVPPRASEPPATKPAIPLAAPTTARAAVQMAPPPRQGVSPVTPPTAPAPAPEAHVAAPPRRPVPAPAEQVDPRKLMNEVFSKELADRSFAGRRALGRRLLGMAPESASKPAEQFVVLAGAREAGKESGSLRLCFEAADALAAAFDVDGRKVKVDAALHVPARADTPAVTADNLRLGLELVDELVEAEDYDTAERLAGWLLPAADASTAPAAQKRLKEITALRLAGERFTQSVERLRAAPDDPAAHLAAGEYLCFVKRQWKEGLRHLARGSDPALKALAAGEESGAAATAPTQQGDGWWDAAASLPEPFGRAARAHAADFYQQAIGSAAGGAAGLRQRVMEERIAEVRKEAPRGVNLLDRIDLARDATAGKWERTPAGLAQGQQSKSELHIPVEPPAEYDLEIGFTRTHSWSAEDLLQTQFPANGDVYRLGLQTWGGNTRTKVGLWERGKNLADSKNAVTLKTPLKEGEKYNLLLQVRRGGVRAFINGESVYAHDGYEGLARAPASLIVGTDHNFITLHELTVTAATGQAAGR